MLVQKIEGDKIEERDMREIIREEGKLNDKKYIDKDKENAPKYIQAWLNQLTYFCPHKNSWEFN